MRSSSFQAIGTIDKHVGKSVEDSFKTAVQMMTMAGYKVRQNVKIAVDPNLPFMGYTMPTLEGFRIVVSGGALGSGMLQGLLVHEMSHVYRIQTNHPSHNGQILEEAVDKYNDVLRSDYQQKIIHDVLNDIQDLYADDIAFKVIRSSSTSLLDKITTFMQDMVTEDVVRSADSVNDRWANASVMLHNARAIAQMARLRIEDTGEKAVRANQRFLAQIPPDMATKFDAFRKRLAGMKEDITAEQYRTFLDEHLHEFMKTTQTN